MRFPPHLLDDIRARLPVSSVVGRRVALKKKGREFAGLSPFKVEKTPSFFVNDQKGFYHCFASGEHGDIFTFLMKTEGLSFPEAVEQLAAEAGVALPKPDAREAERADARERLYAVLAAAAQFYRDQLRTGAGAEARAYLDKRGLKPETIERFGLGFAPDSRKATKEHLSRLGFSLEEMIASGTLIAGDDIPEPYDRFRRRVMFPIADTKGRIIAFGGRALDPAQPAKYLNSPETPLFHKGNVLYNAHRARPAAHEKGRVLVVEGYMDAVSLAEAGFGESVAPLGTALTEDQVQLLWRMTPEPILCFDGDSAGRKAAFRAVDVVIPHLKPGASVRFAFLPDGLDPDDLIRREGAPAMEAVLSRTRPLVDVLFEREWQAGDWSTPERRARLEQTLRGLVAKISDGSVRAHYERELRDRLFAAWGRGGNQTRARQPGSKAGQAMRQPYRAAAGGRNPANRGGRVPSGGPWPPDMQASTSLRDSGLVSGAGAPPYREALLLKTLLNHPRLIDDHAETIASLALTSSALSQLRDAILSAHAIDNSLDSQTLATQLSKSGLGVVMDLVGRAITHKCDRFAEPDAEDAEVDDGWRHTLALHERQVGLRHSLEAAERSFFEDGSEDALQRICEIKELMLRESQALTPDDSDSPTGVEQRR